MAQVTKALFEQSKPDTKDYLLSKQGVYHIGGLGCVSRFDFAQAILSLDPIGRHIANNLIPALTSDFPTLALRPLNTSLNCDRFLHVFGMQMSNWDEVLPLAMQE